jgi:hypothetical protein
VRTGGIRVQRKQVRPRVSAILAVALLSPLLRPFVAASQEPRLLTSVDTTVITIGDRITFQVQVDHAPDAQVAWPDSLDLSPFQVVEARTSPSRVTGDGARSALTLILTAFELGELELPRFDIEILGPAEESTLLSTSPYGIQVVSVGLDEGGDIRDVRGPLSIPMDPLRIFLIALVVVLAAAFLFWVSRRMRPGELRASGTTPAEQYRPPHEVALEELERLAASPLLERGEVKEFHIRVSEILRVYVEGRFQVPALEMTTFDTIAGMDRAGIDPSVTGTFRDFLHRCDMVKFAKHRPPAEICQETLALGRSLVETTIPEPAAVATGESV